MKTHKSLIFMNVPKRISIHPLSGYKGPGKFSETKFFSIIKAQHRIGKVRFREF
jgi:hypothetical protein